MTALLRPFEESDFTLAPGIIAAKRVAASRIYPGKSYEQTLSTLLIRFPRCILAEFNTHRVFSKNTASSRAIPIEKMIATILSHPFIPYHWGKNQKGMQAFSECNEPIIWEGYDPECPQNTLSMTNVEAWLAARDDAIKWARRFSAAGYHKQIVNRLIEPFSYTLMVVSSTNWSNFLHVRDHADAEPHIQLLAKAIRQEVSRTDDIRILKPGEWHLPFVNASDLEEIGHFVRKEYGSFNKETFDFEAIKLSTARCASTSFKTVDGLDMDIARASALYDKLVGSDPLHASPCEHQACGDKYIITDSDSGYWKRADKHGNFTGFIQNRKLLEGEFR